jgi:PAS domain S-box-containing protein
MDAAGEATFVDPLLCEILGASEATLMGPGLLGQFHPDDRERALARISERRTGADASAGEYRLARAPRGERWIRVSGSPIRDAAGTITGIAGALEDITALRSASSGSGAPAPTAPRAPRDENLDVLTRRIAHEINNLLGVILGNATLVLMDVDPASEAAGALADVNMAAERAAALTGELLSRARRGAP